MRICLASIHPRMLSGQIEGLVALAEQLEGLGHEVRLVSAFAPRALRSDQRWTARSADHESLLSKLGAMAGVVRRVVATAVECDLLHFNVPTPSFAAVADLVQLISRRPMVVGFEAHLADVPAVATRLRAAPEFYAPRILINNGLVARGTLQRARRWIVSSFMQRDQLAALGYPEERVDIIPNLIDTEKLTRVDRTEARARLGLPNGGETLRSPRVTAAGDPPLVGFVGHYHDVKGHDLLIDAFPRIRKQIPNARLVFAWSGIGREARVRARIERRGIADHFVQLGRVSVSDLFSAVDVMALPYRFSIGQAAFPGTVLEAMTVGTPLVTSDLPLLQELVEDGSTGLLVRPGASDDLAEKVMRLLADADLRAPMVAAQREVMRTRFEPRLLAGQYVQTYERALAGQARLLQPA